MWAEGTRLICRGCVCGRQKAMRESAESERNRCHPGRMPRDRAASGLSTRNSRCGFLNKNCLFLFLCSGKQDFTYIFVNKKDCVICTTEILYSYYFSPPNRNNPRRFQILFKSLGQQGQQYNPERHPVLISRPKSDGVSTASLLAQEIVPYF